MQSATGYCCLPAVYLAKGQRLLLEVVLGAQEQCVLSVPPPPHLVPPETEVISWSVLVQAQGEPVLSADATQATLFSGLKRFVDRFRLVF